MRALLGLLAGLLLAGSAGAAQLTATIDRSRVQVGDPIRLTIEASGVSRNLGDPDLSPLEKDFDIYPAGSARNFSMINGRTSTSIAKHFNLVARREGSFVIGPFEIDVDGTRLRTEAITVQVTKAPPPPSPPQATDGETGTTAGTEAMFVRASVDRSDPYVYEQVTLRIRLYTRLQLLDNPGYTPPTTQGFWREELPARNPYVESVGGVQYQVLEIAMAIFPTAPGDLTVGEVGLDCTVRDDTRRQDPFSVFRMDGKRVVLRTEPVTIHVKPLPAGAPPGFSGAVGEYQLTTSVDRTQVSQADPVTVTVTVSGNGHLRTIGDLELPVTPDFRAYPSQVEQTPRTGGDRIGGTVKKQFVLVPLRAGELTIPPVRLPVFSPKQGTYTVLESDPVTVQAAAGSGSAGAGGYSGGARGDIEVLGRDIRFIETRTPAFVPVGGVWNRARMWLLLMPVPAAAYLGLWGLERRRRRLGADTALRRRVQAAKRARTELKRAAGAEGAAHPNRAAQAVRGYVADRFDLPTAGLTRDRIERALDGFPERENLLEFLDRADAAEYAPAGMREGISWLAEATEWIRKLEDLR